MKFKRCRSRDSNPDRHTARGFCVPPQSEGHDRDSWINGFSGLSEIHGFAVGSLPFALPSRACKRKGTQSNGIDYRRQESANIVDSPRSADRLNRPQSHNTDLDQPPNCEWHSGGRRFDPDRLHHYNPPTVKRLRPTARVSPEGSCQPFVSPRKPRPEPGKQGAH